MDHKLPKSITDEILALRAESALTPLEESVCKTLIRLGCEETIINIYVQDKNTSGFQEYLKQKGVRLVHAEHLQVPSASGYYFYRNGDPYPCAFVSDIHMSYKDAEDGWHISCEIKTWHDKNL